jgi:hypothetical protein
MSMCRERVPRATLHFENKSLCGQHIRAQDTESRSGIGSSAASYSEGPGLKSWPEYLKFRLRFSWGSFSPFSQTPTVSYIKA